MSKKFKDLNEVLNTIMRNDLSDEERDTIEKLRAERKAREAQNSKSKSNQNRDNIIPNRGAYDDWQKGLNKDKPTTSNNANSTGQRGSSGGLTDAQLKALKDKVDADRRAGKTSDIRGGNDKVDGFGKPKTPVANTPTSKPTQQPTQQPTPRPQSSSSNLKPGSPNETKDGTKFERRLPTRAELRAAQAARRDAPKVLSRAEIENRAIKASVNAGKSSSKPAASVTGSTANSGGYQLPAGARPVAATAATGAATPAAGATPARPAATPAAARPAVTGAGNRTADLDRARRQAMLKTVSKSPNAQRIAARNPMVQRAIAAERGAVNQSIRNSVARANTSANLNRTAPQKKLNPTTGGVQSVGSGGAPTTAKKKEPLFESKKTFSQFMEEAHNLNEALPLAIPIAMKLGSLALGAYSAYQAGKKLKKGDYKGAALDAIGALPVGRAVSGIARGFGAGKRIQQAAGIVGDLAKYEVPNEKNKLINKAIDKGIDLVSGTPGQGSSTQASKPAATPKPTPAATPAATTKPQQTSAQREAQARSTTTTTQTKPKVALQNRERNQPTTKPTSTTNDSEKKKPPTRMQSMQSASRWV